MSGSNGLRQPKAVVTPQSRQIKSGGDPDSFDKDTPGWQFHRLDIQHPEWGWSKVDKPAWVSVLQQLQSFERMTWAKIKEQSGGRAHGTNSHTLDINDFVKDARDRWSELNLDEYDSVFSLRLQGKLRIYGIREGRVLKIIWHDPHHGPSGKGAYPTKGK